MRDYCPTPLKTNAAHNFVSARLAACGVALSITVSALLGMPDVREPIHYLDQMLSFRNGKVRAPRLTGVCQRRAVNDLNPTPRGQGNRRA